MKKGLPGKSRTLVSELYGWKGMSVVRERGKRHRGVLSSRREGGLSQRKEQEDDKSKRTVREIERETGQEIKKEAKKEAKQEIKQGIKQGHVKRGKTLSVSEQLKERDDSERRTTGGQNKSVSTACAEPASLADLVKNLQYGMEKICRIGASVLSESRLREKGDAHQWLMTDTLVMASGDETRLMVCQGGVDTGRNVHGIRVDWSDSVHCCFHHC